MSVEGDVARGPGPWWFRVVLVIAAGYYFLGISLFDHGNKVPLPGALRPLFQATALFPTADRHVIEYHLEGWSCTARAWQPMDPRPYFTVHADDKESRFQRVMHFYDEDPGKHGKWLRPVMRAMEKFLVEHHGTGDDDGVAGPIGGIHVFKTLGPMPAPGDDISRYEYQPLDKIPVADQNELFHTSEAHRNRQCSAGGWVDYPAGGPDTAEEDP